jgi:hypothetical protein
MMHSTHMHMHMHIRPLEYQLSSFIRALFVRQNRLTDVLTALTNALTDALTDAPWARRTTQLDVGARRAPYI